MPERTTRHSSTNAEFSAKNDVPPSEEYVLSTRTGVQRRRVAELSS
jgi:hypothetical protein